MNQTNIKHSSVKLKFFFPFSNLEKTLIIINQRRNYNHRKESQRKKIAII